MAKVIAILFYALAFIHVLPALSGMSRGRLAGLYGLDAGDEALMTLMQHRSVLFALAASACVYAAHVASARWPVLIAVFISMASFIVIAISRGQLSSSLSKIAYVDGIGLLIAALLAAIFFRT